MTVKKLGIIVTYPENLEVQVLKQKDAYPYEHIDSFRRFSEDKLPDRKCFYNSVKDKTTDDNGKKLDGHISNKIIWLAKKFGMNFT